MLRNAASISSSGTCHSSPTAACCFSGEQSQQNKEFAPPFPLSCSFSMSRRMGEGQKTLEERGSLTSFTLLPTSHSLVRLTWLGFGRTQSWELHTGNLVQGPALPVEPKSSHRSKLEFRL